MTVAPGIGRTLARLAALSQRRSPEGDSRGEILQLVSDAPAPVSVEWLCDQTGLHANTVRGHLEVLVAAGRVERSAGERRGRGRPPLLYRSVTHASDLYVELVASLKEQLADQMDDSAHRVLVDEAAARWAEVGSDPVEAADTPDAAVERAAGALDRLGFTADVSPVGDSIVLGNCPYLELVREQPIICEIHTALLKDLLARTGQPVTVTGMEVFPAPGLCRAHLDRPDRTPEWVVGDGGPSSSTPTPPKNRKSKGSS